MMTRAGGHSIASRSNFKACYTKTNLRPKETLLMADSAEPLVLSVEVDTKDLQLLNQQSDAVAAAFLRLAEAQFQSNIASTVAANTLKAMATGELPNVASTMKTYAEQLKAAREASVALKDAQEQVSESLKKTSQGAEDAGAELDSGRGGGGHGVTGSLYKVQLGARDMGIMVPRAMERVIASCPAAAAAIETIFPALVLIGFLEIASRLPAAIARFASEMGGLTEEVKQQDEFLTKLNQEWVNFNVHLQVQQNHLPEGLLTGTRKVRQEQTDLNKDLKGYIDLQEQAATRARILGDLLNGTHKETRTVSEPNAPRGRPVKRQETIDVANVQSVPAELAGLVPPSAGGAQAGDSLGKDQIKAVTSEWEHAQQEAAKYQQIIKELQQIKLPQTQQTLSRSELKDTQQMNEAQLASYKATQEKMLEAQKVMSEARYSQGLITIQQLTKAEEKYESDKYNLELHALQRLRDIKKEDPNTNPAEIARIDGQITTLKATHLDEQAKKYAEVMAKQKELLKEFTHAVEEETIHQRDAAQRVAEEGLRKAERDMHADVEALRRSQTEREQAQQQHVEAMANLQERAIQDSFTRGQINAAQELAQLRSLHAAEFKQEMDALKARRQAIEADASLTFAERVEATAKVDIAISKLEDKYRSTQLRDTDIYVNAITKKYQQLLGTVTGNFNTAITGWLQGTQKFSEAWKKAWGSMAISAIQNLIKVAEKHAMVQLSMLAQHQAANAAKTASDTLSTTQSITLEDVLFGAHVAGNQAKVASDAAAAGETKAITSLTGKGKVQSEAAQAAAGAYNAMSDIPIVGPALGAIAAAATWAGVMAFESLAAFERGGLVPDTGIAMLHGGEMVLPANISQPLQQAIQSGDGFGGNQFHLYATTQISAIDGPSVHRMLALHGDVISEHVFQHIKRRVNNGALRGRPR